MGFLVGLPRPLEQGPDMLRQHVVVRQLPSVARHCRERPADLNQIARCFCTVSIPEGAPLSAVSARSEDVRSAAHGRFPPRLPAVGGRWLPTNGVPVGAGRASRVRSLTPRSERRCPGGAFWPTRQWRRARSRALTGLFATRSLRRMTFEGPVLRRALVQKHQRLPEGRGPRQAVWRCRMEFSTPTGPRPGSPPPADRWGNR